MLWKIINFGIEITTDMKILFILSMILIKIVSNLIYEGDFLNYTGPFIYGKSWKYY